MRDIVRKLHGTHYHTIQHNGPWPASRSQSLIAPDDEPATTISSFMSNSTHSTPLVCPVSVYCMVLVVMMVWYSTVIDV